MCVTGPPEWNCTVVSGCREPRECAHCYIEKNHTQTCYGGEISARTSPVGGSCVEVLAKTGTFQVGTRKQSVDRSVLRSSVRYSYFVNLWCGGRRGGESLEFPPQQRLQRGLSTCVLCTCKRRYTHSFVVFASFFFLLVRRARRAKSRSRRTANTPVLVFVRL